MSYILRPLLLSDSIAGSFMTFALLAITPEIKLFTTSKMNTLYLLHTRMYLHTGQSVLVSS